MDGAMQILGLLGAGLLLLAYFKNSTSKWTSRNISYHVTNLGGAVLICVNTYYFSVYGPFILNIFWALIALNGIKLYLSKETTI